jgi:hypothetical protein
MEFSSKGKMTAEANAELRPIQGSESLIMDNFATVNQTFVDGKALGHIQRLNQFYGGACIGISESKRCPRIE